MGRILDQGAFWPAVALALAATLLLRLPLRWLVLMAAVFVPAGAVIGAKLESTVSLGVALERDYMPALVCHLMAWTAALAPLALLQWLLAGSLALPPIVFAGAAFAYFLALSVCAIRTIAGTSFARATGAAGAALAVAAACGWAYAIAGSVSYLFASPWVLYYLYITFGSDVRSFGRGLSSRQHLRQLLETSTVNPRDADAHYQLGLIYQHRRDFAKAKECFERAIAIDPREPDAQYQLGSILRAGGDAAGALEHLEAAAAIDDKLASSEVWREIGVAHLELQHDEHARDVLRAFTARRPFDAEGLYWYGVALARLGETSQAREALEAAREAVRTAPPHRRRQIRRWEGLASRQLRTLGSS